MGTEQTSLKYDVVKRRIPGYEGIYRIPSQAELTLERVAVADMELSHAFRWDVSLDMDDAAWGKLAGGKGASYMRRLAHAIAEGKRLPPLVVVLAHAGDARPCEGRYRIDDGHHRAGLALALGVEELEAYVYDAHEHRPTQAERNWLITCYRMSGGKAAVPVGELPDEDNMHIRMLAAHDAAVERYDTTH
jgi:hypothetical protein